MQTSLSSPDPTANDYWRFASNATHCHGDIANWNFDFRNLSIRACGYVRLPPLHEALSLLREYFDNFNCVFPLFHQSSFMSRVEYGYSRDLQGDPVWWAALNTVLALALRLRAMSTLSNHLEDAQAWSYLQNALSVFSDLAFRDTDLFGIQTILGMAIIFQTTPNPHPASVLIAAAIRLSAHLGLHKKTSESELTAVDLEQRNRVFWVGYLLDKDYSLYLDQPPILHDDDLDVEAPTENPQDSLGYIHEINGTNKINCFRFRVHLAAIENKIYAKLYSS